MNAYLFYRFYTSYRDGESLTLIRIKWIELPERMTHGGTVYIVKVMSSVSTLASMCLA